MKVKQQLLLFAGEHALAQEVVQGNTVAGDASTHEKELSTSKMQSGKTAIAAETLQAISILGVF